MKLAYRIDVDGLRALAVLAVIVYHFNKAWLPGGFLGVDIFFVISGFLITSIIFSEIKANEFSLKAFYLRRIKRILPASIFVISISLLACYLVFLPHDFDRAAKSALTSLIFISNFFCEKCGLFCFRFRAKPFSAYLVTKR